VLHHLLIKPTFLSENFLRPGLQNVLNRKLVRDMSPTCLRPVQDLSETRFKQVSDKIDVIECGLKLLNLPV